jgi:hypothetical protein
MCPAIPIRRGRRIAGSLPCPRGNSGWPPRNRDSPGETRTKEYQMTSNEPAGNHILGSLRTADGTGVVRIEDRYDTDIDSLWSALTEPSRLARWYGQINCDLRPGGEFHGRLEYWEGTGRVEACEPPHRLLVTTKGADEPYHEHIEATRAGRGRRRVDLVRDVVGLPGLEPGTSSLSGKRSNRLSYNPIGRRWPAVTRHRDSIPYAACGRAAVLRPHPRRCPHAGPACHSVSRRVTSTPPTSREVRL